MSVAIHDATHSIELGLLDYISGLLQDAGGGWVLIRVDGEQRIGASCTLRNRVGVEAILEVEVRWEPEA